MTPEEVRAQAKPKLKRICGVIKECDGLPGRMCQGQAYGGPIGLGGAGAGYSFANNVEALKHVHLKMKVIGPHFTPDTSVELFGRKIGVPFFGAPVTGANSFGGEETISEADFCQATVEGCKAAGSMCWRGDSVNYSLDHPYGINAIKAAGGWGVKIIKPRSQEMIKEFIKLAEDAGATAVGVDVDGCGSYQMTSHEKPVFRKSSEELEDLIQSTELPFIVKGLMCVEDAEAAVSAGAAAIVVSNHGGRVLDHTPGAAAVLPEIAAAVNGRCKVFADGGVRTGYDILKMLALGADGVLIGRDIMRAAVGGGAEGVQVHMQLLRTTLATAMLMTGCADISDVCSDILA